MRVIASVVVVILGTFLCYCDMPAKPSPPACTTEVATVGECTESTSGLLSASVGACAVITQTGARITVLRPVMVGDKVCSYRQGFYKVKGQPVVR